MSAEVLRIEIRDIELGVADDKICVKCSLLHFNFTNLYTQ